jgi:hypothetical protein
MAWNPSAGASAVRYSGVFELLALLVESSRAFVPPGTLPKGSRVEIVQVEPGWFESREIGEGPAAGPFGIPELAVTRPLPVSEEIVFTVPPR